MQVSYGSCDQKYVEGGIEPSQERNAGFADKKSSEHRFACLHASLTCNQLCCDDGGPQLTDEHH